MSHPSDADLERWLQSGEPQELALHVGSCDACTATLERLTDSVATSRVTDFVAAPSDFEQAMAERVDESLRRNEALEALAALFTIGFDTVAVMLGEHIHEH